MNKILNFFNTKGNNFYALLLFCTIILLHIKIVFAPTGYFFSSLYISDLKYFINIREYTATSLISGNLPLWTLKIFSGHPFLANYETAVFYPLNFIFLILPISKAINWSFLIHFFILAFSVYLWINNKIYNKPLSFLIGIISVFSANFYLHACAGHLSNIITMAWFPLLLYFYDKNYNEKNYKYLPHISIIICLQIFAGHMQYVYYTALVSFLYILFFCLNKKTIITFLISYAFAVLLCAIQLLPSIEFTLAGSKLTGALNYISIKAHFIEILTLICPFYTENLNIYFWETAIYVGLFNFLIILLAIFHDFKKETIKYLILIVFLYLLTSEYISASVGSFIPMFNSFRSPVKLNFFISILFMPLLAKGFIYTISSKKINVYYICSLFFILFNIIIFNKKITKFLISSFVNVINLQKITSSYGLETIVYTALACLFVYFLFLKKYYKLISLVFIFLLVLIQPVIFSKSYFKVFHLNNNFRYTQFEIKNLNNDIRYLSNKNYNLKYNYENIFGMGPDVLKNYYALVETIDFSDEKIFSLLRLKYLVNDETKKITEFNIKTLSRINVFYDYVIETDKDKTFDILKNSDFDIFQRVVLAKKPDLEITKTGVYSTSILSLKQNSIEFECETTEPAIVLITDNYYKGWIAYDLDNPKNKYEIIAGDYIYKAICIAKGKHKIRLEYKPQSFIIGFWISIISLVLFSFICIFPVLRNK